MGRKGVVWSMALALLPAAVPAAAEGIPMGRVMFYPALELNYIWDDNVFLQDEQEALGEISSGQQYYRANLKWELPFSRSSTTIFYSPQFRAYSSDQVVLNDNLNHEFELDSEFNLSSGLQLVFKEKYLRDNVRVGELEGNQGSEVQFGTDTFETNDANLSFKYQLVPRHELGGGVQFLKTEFSTRQDPSFFNTEGINAVADYRYDLSPSRQLRFAALYGEMDQERADVILDDQSEDYQDLRFEAEFEGKPGGRFDFMFRVGYRALRFQMSDESDFSGVIGRVIIGYRPVPHSRIRIILDRDAFPSFFENQNFYVSNRINVLYQRDLPRGFFWNAEGGYRWNRYEDPLENVFGSLAPESVGGFRKDELWKLGGGIGYQFRETMSVGIGIRQTGRDSNVVQLVNGNPIPGEDFEGTQIGIQVKFGWE